MKISASLTGVALLFTTVTAIAQTIPAQTAATHKTIPVCYMQIQQGTVVNLDRLCGVGLQDIVQQTRVDSRPVKDQHFLEDLKQSLQGSPSAHDALSLIDPQTAIAQAQEICKTLEEGTFLNYRQAQMEKAAGSSDVVVQNITNLQFRTIQTIAPKHYCPGFDG